MTLPTGTISLSQVNTELGKSSTATISLNDSAVRSLAGKTSGTISMNDLRGKSAATTFTMYVGQADMYVKTCSTMAIFGYSPTLAPNGCGIEGTLSPTTYNGVTVRAFLSAEYGQTNDTFAVRMQGNRAKNFFNSVALDGVTLNTSVLADLGTDPSSPSGSYRAYSSSSDQTTWIWEKASYTLPYLTNNVGTNISVVLS